MSELNTPYTMQKSIPIDIKEVLTSISTRMPWLTGKPLLESLGLIVSNGWKPTIDRVHWAPESKEYQRAFPILNQIFMDHILFGEKIIRQFSLRGIPPGQIKSLTGQIKSFCENFKKPHSSKFFINFPFPLRDRSELRKLSDLNHTLMSAYKDGSLYVFQYCTVRSYRERVELDITQFEGARRYEQLSEYEEFFAISPTYRQCYDAVVFDTKNDLFELRLDAPKGMSVEELYNAVEHLANTFNNLCIKEFNFTPCGKNTINLYKAIGNLYRKKGEGQVYELGFTANANANISNNNGKLVKGKNRDLRLDQFHVGGKKNVTDVVPYRIGVEWKGGGVFDASGQELTGNPRLYLPGTARMLNKAPCEISLAYITNCITRKDYEFVKQKLDIYKV